MVIRKVDIYYKYRIKNKYQESGGGDQVWKRRLQFFVPESWLPSTETSAPYKTLVISGVWGQAGEKLIRNKGGWFEKLKNEK